MLSACLIIGGSRAEEAAALQNVHKKSIYKCENLYYNKVIGKICNAVRTFLNAMQDVCECGDSDSPEQQLC